MRSDNVFHLMGLPSVDRAPTGHHAGGMWEIKKYGPLEPLLDIMVSDHERAHGSLNQCTSHGAFLSGLYSLCEVHAGQDYEDLLKAAVRHCRRVHEMYATYLSARMVVDASGSITVGEILAPYPAYQAYFEEAEKLGPHPAAPTRWHVIAVLATLEVSMQSLVLQRINDAGLPTGLGQGTVGLNVDRPNQRLAVLTKILPQSWSSLSSLIDEKLQGQWREISEIPAGRADLANEVPEGAWEAAAELVAEAARLTLAREGYPSLDTEDFLEADETFRRILATEFPDKIAFDSVSWRQRGAISAQDPARSAATAYASELIRLREPRKARVLRFAEVCDLSVFMGGEPGQSHFLVAARSVAGWRREFDIAEDAFGETDPNEVVQALQAPAGSDTDAVTLAVLSQPDQLNKIRQVESELGILSAVYSTAVRNQQWQKTWLLPLSEAGLHVFIIDEGFVSVAGGLIKASPQLQFSLTSIKRSGSSEEPDATTVLLLRSPGDTLVVAPCSYQAGIALQLWIHGSSGRRGSTKEMTQAESAELAALVNRQVSDASTIGFWK